VLGEGTQSYMIKDNQGSRLGWFSQYTLNFALGNPGSLRKYQTSLSLDHFPMREGMYPTPSRAYFSYMTRPARLRSCFFFHCFRIYACFIASQRFPPTDPLRSR
jgi:hypothetical protein